MSTFNNPREMRVMIVGNVGKGKSSLGNSLLGSKKFPVTATSAANDDTNRPLSSNYGMVQLSDRTSMAVVDTPGLLDNSLYEINKIGSYLDLLAPGPHVLLFVVRIGRFTPGEMATFRQLVHIFGEDVLNFLIVIFTGKDDLDADDETIDGFLDEVPDSLKSLLKDCKGRYAAINNRAKGDSLRQDVDHIIELMRETVYQNSDNFYSMDMFKRARSINREKVRERERREALADEPKKKKKDDGLVTLRRVAIVAVSLLVIWGCYKLYSFNL